MILGIGEDRAMSMITAQHDNDDRVEESLRRSREMDENPEMSLTEEEFFASFKEYRSNKQ
jgi:hypothetical protein